MASALPTSDWKSQLHYFAAHRWPGCPCGSPDCGGKSKKRPAHNGWQSEASNDPDHLAQLLSHGWNPAILCGQKSNLTVIDQENESKFGMVGIRELEKIVGRQFPTTHRVRTGSGGYHHYFTFNPQHPLMNSVRFLTGLDVRTEGGLVLAHGARHENGDNYKSIDDLPPIDLPEDFAIAIEKCQRESKTPKLEPESRHNYLNNYALGLLKRGLPIEEVEVVLPVRNRRLVKPHDGKEIERILADIKTDLRRGKIEVPNAAAAEIDPDSWRQDTKSFNQLSSTPRQFALSQLVPMKALTYLCGASFNGKTWIALAWALAMSTGKPWLRFYPPAHSGPIPCLYHVPEMDEALVREYMAQLKFEESENFLVRPMECALWQLNDPRMLRSSVGRVVFLDTAGYFNPTDDTNSYSQVIAFAKLIQNMLQNGALAVVGLYHPPKYANKDSEVWTLENSVLGSAGYGGLLRSCVRVKNLNADLNDKNVRIYCQGMKNPGLKPFQLQGPPPLTMKLYPSPYLSTLQAANDPRAEEIFKGFDEGKKTRELQKEHHISPNKLATLKKQWDSQRKAAEEAANTSTQGDLMPTAEDFVDGGNSHE